MTRRAWVQALGAVVLLLGAVLLTPADRAAAHADYESSTPAKNEVLSTAPSQIDVYFDGNVFRQEQPPSYYVRVFADDGITQVSTGNGTLDDNDRTHISTALPGNLAQGRYIVRWMTTSDEDGDTDDGAFCFYIGVQPTAAQQAECASFEPTPVPTLSGTAAQAAQPTPTAASATDDDGGNNTGVIIGVVVGVIVAVVVVGGAGLWWRSRRA